MVDEALACRWNMSLVLDLCFYSACFETNCMQLYDLCFDLFDISFVHRCDNDAVKISSLRGLTHPQTLYNGLGIYFFFLVNAKSLKTMIMKVSMYIIF